MWSGHARKHQLEGSRLEQEVLGAPLRSARPEAHCLQQGGMEEMGRTGIQREEFGGFLVTVGGRKQRRRGKNDRF